MYFRSIKYIFILISSIFFALYGFNYLMPILAPQKIDGLLKCNFPWEIKGQENNVDYWLIDGGWRNEKYVRNTTNFKVILEDTLCLNSSLYNRNGVIKIKPFPNSTYDFNSLGYRGGEWIENSGKKKLFIVGASTAFSYLNSEKNMIDNFLKVKFVEDGIKFDVFNAAIPGINPINEYLIVKEIVGLRPDYIVIINGFNSGSGGLGEYTSLDNSEHLMSNTLAILRDFASYIQLNNISALLNQILEKKPTEKLTSVEAFELGVKSIQEECVSRSINCIFVLQPNITVTRKFLTKSEKQIKRLWTFNDEVTFSLNHQKSYKLFRSILEKPNYSFLDASNLAEDIEYADQEIFLDAAHLTPVGNQLLADRIYNYIAKDVSGSQN